MKLGVQDLLLPLEQIVREELGLHIFKTQALDGLGEPLAGLALLPEQQNSLLNDVQGLVLVGEDLAQSAALGGLFAQRPPI